MQRPSVYFGTRALWRFENNYHLLDEGCVGSGPITRDQVYAFYDVNNSTVITLGRCQYSDPAICTSTATLSATLQAPSVLPGFTCPANPVGAPGATTLFAYPADTGAPVPFADSTGTLTTQIAGPALWASTGDFTTWDLPVSYTLSAWVRINGGVNTRIMNQDDGVNFWGFGVGPTGRLSHFDSREKTTPLEFSTGPVINDNVWHYVAVVRENGVGRRFYVDGLLVGTTVAFSTIAFSNANGNGINSGLFIGRRFDGTQAMDARITDLRLHPGVLLTNTLLMEYDTRIHYFSTNGGISFSTAAGTYLGNPSNGTTAAQIFRPQSVPFDPQQQWQFLAQSADGSGTTAITYSVSIDNSPPSPTTLSGTPTSPLDVNWTWTVPAAVCGPPTFTPIYSLYNSTSGTLVATIPNAFSYAENFPLETPNIIRVRYMTVTDNWGTSVLSNHATAYTLAAVPVGFTTTIITTGSISLAWGANNNPPYTRYEVTYSPDNFTATTSTAVSMGDNYTATSIAISGLAPGTTYAFRVRAFNGRASDFFGGIPTAYASVSAITAPLPPLLSGSALSQTDILWSWSAVTGASGYRLYRAGGAPLLADTALTSFTEASLSTNTAYGAEVEAYNASGASLRSNVVFVFTRASTPTAAAVTSVSTYSATYAWNANGNPAYTFYEVNVATDAAFSVVVATRSGASTTLTVTGLFPSSTYYARLRSFSGNQFPGAFVLMGSTITNADPAVAIASSPPSAYANPLGLAGVWHFDESTGTLVADASGAGNTGTLTCLGAGCASTPTFTTGPPLLGSAVQFSGVADSLVRVPNPAALNFNGSLTVAAWAKPSSAVQPSGAGIVAKGDAGDEAFALDVFGGRYRFLVRTVTPALITVVATSTIRVGEWDHVAGVYDIANSQARIYINGVLSATVATAGANRVVNAHDFSVGSRQSGAAAYDLGFAGAVDDPRVIAAALTNAQIQQEYAGALPGALSLPAPAGASLVLPPNAFGGPAQIFSTNDPLNHPIRVAFSALADGLANTPTGQLMIAGSLIEIVPTVGGLPFTANLGSSATLVLPFSDADANGLVDGVNPPISVGTLRVYTLNTAVNRWEALPTTVDAASRRVSAQVPHFSIFAMFGATTIGQALSQVLVYPVPWRVGAGDKFDATHLVFERLPAEGTIRLLTLAGQRVRELRFSGPDAGRKLWDGRNESGHPVASGVYFAIIKGADGSTAIKKVAIER